MSRERRANINELIQQAGDILDWIHYLGPGIFLSDDSPIHYLQNWLEKIEQELLFQWKLNQEKGEKAHENWLQIWIQQERRKKGGILESWQMYCSSIWTFVNNTPWHVRTSVWQSYLIYQITNHDSYDNWQGVWKTTAADETLEKVLSIYRRLYEFNPYTYACDLMEWIQENCGQSLLFEFPGELNLPETMPEWTLPYQELWDEEKLEWDQLQKNLQAFWQSHSGGLFSQYSAFRLSWNDSGKVALKGMQLKEQVTFSELVGIENIQQALTGNIKRFFQTGHAHHVLLWGHRGTGKSSSVLALLNEFAAKGLCLIEVKQEELQHLPEIYHLIEQRPEKFILFCDDISFDENDSSYKHVKSFMEGSLIQLKGNLLFHVTSNRKDLVDRGYIDERKMEKRQILDERRAIDDRFGIKLFFDVPQFHDLDRLLYYFADKAELQLSREDLKQQFNRFCLFNQHDSPSVRTIKQFLQQFEGS